VTWRIWAWEGLQSQRQWLRQRLLSRLRLSRLLRAAPCQHRHRAFLLLASKFKTRMRSKMKREICTIRHRLLDFHLQVIFSKWAE
jgi:hypothetical protein